MKSRYVMLTLAAALSLSLAACGGGGGDDASEGSTPPGGTTTDPQPAPPAGETPAPADSYWNLNDYRYVSGGYNALQFSPFGNTYLAVAVYSTATLSGGDDKNGAYSGSNVSMSFLSEDGKTYSPGTYTIDRTVGTIPSARAMTLVVTAGTNVTTGAVQYEAVQGQVDVTVDAQGKPHFSSKGPISVRKQIEVRGGIPGAPETMNLTLKDVH